MIADTGTRDTTAADTTVTDTLPPGDTTAGHWRPPFDRSVTIHTGVDSADADPVLPATWLVSDNDLDRARIAEITGRGRIPHLLLRSPGTLLRSSGEGFPRLRVLGPEVQLVHNSTLPWSMNDGALWAGRGLSTRIIAGVAAKVGPLRMVIAPELVASENRHFDLRVPWIERPEVPPDRSPWQFEWYAAGPYSIDMPTRFGAERIQRILPGQSSIALAIRAVEFGIASESNWWGPGIRNALILSNNAPGFPHLFLRAARPLETRIGEADFRWLVGGLTESDYFDDDESNDLRSISGGAVTLRLHRPKGLTLGLARTVWGTSTGWGQIPGRWFELFRAVGRPNDLPLSDSLLHPGSAEQLYSLFGRWVMPAAGLEAYFEWGRTEFPASVRDLFVAPGHTQAYTLGLQWVMTAFRESHQFRVQLENTSVEQSTSFRNRPLGVWYTSRRIIQGYTNEGQPLGAAVGPGSSGQTLLLDYLWPQASLGLLLGRTRYNEDVRSIFAMPDFKAWCTHDINLYGGLRGTLRSRFGLVELDLTPAYRIQPWFQVGSGCPRGDAMVDIRNSTLRLTLSR